MFLVRTNNHQHERISLPPSSIHVLLLGAGDVGKSTLFKQFTIIYGDAFSDGASRRNFIDVVHHNVLTQTQGLIEFTKSVQPEFDVAELEIPPRFFNTNQLSSSHADEVLAVLQNDSVRRSLQQYRHRHSLEHFSRRLQDILFYDYVPSREDILATRTRTLGLVDQQLNVNGVRMKVTDTGGQRNERKKWWHVTETASCAIFVINLNGYILSLYEDTSQNCLKEDLAAFHHTINNPNSSHLPFVVLLNQKDLFQKTLQAERQDAPGILRELHSTLGSMLLVDLVPLIASYCSGVPQFPFSYVFSDFGGGNFFEPTVDYIIARLKSLNGRNNGPPVTFHAVCALDTDEVRGVLSQVFEQLPPPVRSRTPSPQPFSPPSPISTTITETPSPRLSPSRSSPNLSPALSPRLSPALVPTISPKKEKWSYSPSRMLRRISQVFTKKQEHVDPTELLSSLENDLTRLSASDIPSRKPVNLSILGVPGAGKSTVFKQFVLIYGQGHPKAIRGHYQSAIEHDVISQMQDLLAINDQFIPPISESFEGAARFVQNANPAASLSLLGVADGIELLMRDPSMPQRLEARNVPNAAYFLPKVKKLAAPMYVPSLQDVLYAYTPTKQNEGLSVKRDTLLVTCVDTASEGASPPSSTNVVFVANLNNFTRVPKTTREAKNDLVVKDLVLFEEVCNSPALAKMNISVFLNQRDRFQVLSPTQAELTKCAVLPPDVVGVVADYCDPNSFTALFPEYKGGDSVDKALEFIQAKMRALDRRAAGTLQFFTLCATQTPQVEAAFTHVLDA